MREGNFSPDKKMGKESLEQLRANLAMHHRDVADYYEGNGNLSKQDVINAEREIQILKKQIAEMEG
jgi:hypothetical protein